jgi:hypothetical protein
VRVDTPGFIRWPARQAGCVWGAMAKQEGIEVEAVVEETLPNAFFRVKLDNDHIVLAHVSG